MSQWSTFRSALVALPLAALIGCGGDGPTGASNELSPALAADAFDALSSISSISGIGGTLLRAEGDVEFPTPSFTVQLDETEPCPVSGNVRLVGSFTINETTGALSADIRETYQNCAATSSSNRQWTFNGNPNVRTVFTFSGDTEETMTGTGTITGGFRYASQGQSGSCTMAVTMSFSSVAISVTGTVCGQNISQQVSFAP